MLPFYFKYKILKFRYKYLENFRNFQIISHYSTEILNYTFITRDISIQILLTQRTSARNKISFIFCYSCNILLLFAALARHLSLGDFLGRPYAALKLRLAPIVIASSVDDDRWTTIDEFPPVNFSTLSKYRYGHALLSSFCHARDSLCVQGNFIRKFRRASYYGGVSQDSREFQWNSLEVFRFRGLAVWSIYRIVKV